MMNLLTDLLEHRPRSFRSPHALYRNCAEAWWISAAQRHYTLDPGLIMRRFTPSSERTRGVLAFVSDLLLCARW